MVYVLGAIVWLAALCTIALFVRMASDRRDEATEIRENEEHRTALAQWLKRTQSLGTERALEDLEWGERLRRAKRRIAEVERVPS